MLEGKRVGVVVPAHDEEALLPQTLAGIPEFVDRIYVVDDASRDATGSGREAAAAGDPRVEVLGHEQNRGVGAAILTGYRRALEERVDVTCVMAADNQMDPADLQAIVEPVARGEVDYAKANRLFTGQAWQLIPKHRYLGNAVLSLLTKIASGYWHVADSQSGYTAIGAADPRAPRPRPDLPALRLPQRHARPPERRQRARAGRPVAPDLRRRRAVGDQAPTRSSRRSRGCS